MRLSLFVLSTILWLLASTIQTTKAQSTIGDEPYASFTTTAAGWYRVGDWGPTSSGRGGVRVVLSLGGGDYAPQSIIIEAYKDWSSATNLNVRGHLSSYFDNVRITKSNSDYYLEVYIDRAIIHNAKIYLYDIEGYVSGFRAYSGALPTGGGEVLSESGNVYNDLSLGGGIHTNGAIIGNVPATNAVGIYGAKIVNNSSANWSQHGMYLQVESGGGYLFKSSVDGGLTKNAFSVNNIGHVGIGIDPQSHAKLAVAGEVYATEVKVQTNVAVPDYVFANDYELRSLKEVKAYVQANSHLPEVPSAKEIEANGIQLGEMNMLLLKKIEELTLYQIQQNEELVELKKVKIKQQEQEKLIQSLISQMAAQSKQLETLLNQQK